MPEIVIKGVYDNMPYSDVLARIAELAEMGGHLTLITVAKTKKAPSMVRATFCTSRVFDYVYATVWKCRNCSHWEHRVPEATHAERT